MKFFEFEQLGRKIRVEVDYRHYMVKETACLDGDIIEMRTQPHESATAKVYIDGELKHEQRMATEYWLRLSEETKIVQGHKAKTIHALRLAIADPKVWEAYEAWISSVVKEGTEEAVKEFLQKEAEKDFEEEFKEAQEIVRLAEEQKDIPPREEANRRMKWWNDTYNEGGEGFVPDIICRERYEKAKEIVRKGTERKWKR